MAPYIVRARNNGMFTIQISVFPHGLDRIYTAASSIKRINKTVQTVLEIRKSDMRKTRTY
jgi:hypothetical protein